MWTPATRRQHSRAGLRYETDLTDAEWAVIAPLMPEPAACGRPATWTPCEILNAIFYVLRGGIAWRLIPKDLPPTSTAFGSFSRWRDEGLFGRINHHLVMADRERGGREASPTAVVLDSQSVKTTESGGPRGYDAGKKVKGRKRQVMVDTDGRGLILEPQPADVQDRNGAVAVLRLSRRAFPFVAKAFADAGYAGDKPATATIITIEIVRKPPDQVGFAVHPRRWVVEVVFTQMAKPNVLAVGAGRQHVADLDFGIGDDDAVDQQHYELTALLEAGRGQSALNALAKRFQRGRHAGELLSASGVAA
jgi:transposase